MSSYLHDEHWSKRKHKCPGCGMEMLDNTAFYICQNQDCLKIWTPIPLTEPTQWKQVFLSKPEPVATCTRGPHRIQEVCPDAHGVPCSPPTETLSQSEIDARNLEFYAMMFRAKRWELQTMSWTVFEATLNEIAERIRRAPLITRIKALPSIKDETGGDCVSRAVVLALLE